MPTTTPNVGLIVNSDKLEHPLRADFKSNFEKLDTVIGNLNSWPMQQKTSFVLMLIELYNALKSVEQGTSGADFISATPIDDLDGSTVQSIIESLRNKLKSVTDGASGADFVNATPIAGLSGSTTQLLIESLKALVDNNKNEYNSHIAGITGKHSASNIAYNGDVAGASNVNEGLNSLKGAIEKIITTPVEGISAQEVIDARNGKGSLGARLDIYDTHIYDIAQLGICDYNIPKTRKKLMQGLDITILINGDSIGGGAGASIDTLAWVALLEEKLKELFPGVNFTFINTSLGGMGTTWLVENWDTLVTQYSPDLILLHHSTNDNELSDDIVKANYAFIQNKVKTYGYEIILSTTEVNAFEPPPYGNTAVEATHDRLEHAADLVREIARQYKWGYVDPNLVRYRFLQHEGLDYNTTITNFDNIHPNNLGHRLIAYSFLMPFLGGVDTLTLDERYAGKNMNTCDEYPTLYDLNMLRGKLNEWERYGLYHQQVTAAGLWIQNELPPLKTNFKTAKLWGTDVTTGSETYIAPTPSRHIVARENDYIKFEVKDAKRIWTQLTGSSATPTTFTVSVDGTVTMTLQVSSTSTVPIEIEYSSGNKIFPKGTHTIKIVRTTAIPTSSYIEWYGFLVRYHDFNKPENNSLFKIGSPRRIESKDILTTTRKIAQDNDIIMPFGYGSADVGFIFPDYGVNVLSWKFWGTELKAKLGTITGYQNNVLVYIDKVYTQTLNLQSDPATQNTYTLATNLSANMEHEVVLLGLKCQTSLFEIITTGTGTKFGVCGVTYPLSGFDTKTIPIIRPTAYYPETGKIPVTSATDRAYIYTFTTGSWMLGTGGQSGLNYMQVNDQNAQVKIKFHGTALVLRYETVDGTGGIFNVTIDGVDKGNTNTSSTSWSLATVTYSSLTDGYHELVLTKTNDSSSLIRLYDIEQTGIVVPSGQYLSLATPTDFSVGGAGEFMYELPY